MLLFIEKVICKCEILYKVKMYWLIYIVVLRKVLIVLGYKGII